MCRRFCGSQEEFDAVYAELKLTACPHCKRVGTLIRHGYLRGYDEQHQRQKTVRAWRIFCNNRKRSNGCGRTFSVWVANKIRRLFLTTDGLWAFLKQAVTRGNRLQVTMRWGRARIDEWRRVVNGSMIPNRQFRAYDRSAEESDEQWQRRIPHDPHPGS